MNKEELKEIKAFFKAQNEKEVYNSCTSIKQFDSIRKLTDNKELTNDDLVYIKNYLDSL